MRFIAFISSLLLAASLSAQTAAPAGTLRNPGQLSPDTTSTVFAHMDMLTSVTFLTDKPIQSVIKGGPEINLMLDGNVMHIQPVVPEGVSSVTLRVDGITYVIRVRITTEDVAVPNPVFSFEKQGRFEDVDKVLAAAPPMKPSDIDINGAIKTIERAQFDGAFRDGLKNYNTLHIGKIYSWNHCEIHFIEAHQFADIDLIVFKVSWVNQQTQAFYLNQNQYQVFVGDKKIPVQARRQLAPRSIVFPGQQETVWLAVQGYKLRLDNDWDLHLPPEASDLRGYTRYSN